MLVLRVGTKGSAASTPKHHVKHGLGIESVSCVGLVGQCSFCASEESGKGAPSTPKHQVKHGLGIELRTSTVVSMGWANELRVLPPVGGDRYHVCC